MASKALMKAVTSARVTQARLMITMDADVNVQDTEGHTPLTRALHLPNIVLRARFLRLLLKAGALVSVADSHQMNALMWACRVGCVRDVALLLHHADVDLDLNAQNVDGQTALWMAVKGNRVDIVQELIKTLSKYEVNFEVADRAGITPSQLAALLGHFRCLRAMIWRVESVGKSLNTLINMSKLGQILNSSSMTNTLERISEVTRPEKSLQPVSGLPGIRVTSAEGHRVLDLSRVETQLADDSDQSLSSVKAPSTSTSIATTHMALSQSLIQACPTTRTAPRQNDHHRKTSLRLSLLENETPQAEHHSRHRIQHQNSQEAPSQRRPSTTNKMSAEPSGNAGADSCPPAVRVRQERRSVKQTLPQLLDIRAQNLSASFRKAAVVKPPTPKPEPPPPTAWCKRKELAFIARLKRADSLTHVEASTAAAAVAAIAAAAAAAAAAAGGGDGAAAAAAGHDPTAGGLARLLLSKRRLAANIKQRSGST